MYKKSSHGGSRPFKRGPSTSSRFSSSSSSTTARPTRSHSSHGSSTRAGASSSSHTSSGRTGSSYASGSRPFSSSYKNSSHSGRPSRFSNNRRKTSNRTNRGEQIDTARFINKNVAPLEAVVYQPQYSFSDFPISDQLKQAVIRKGYKTPTPIQDQAIPHVLNNKDVVGIANTGTGKTAAFLIPLIDKVLNDSNQRALIMVPTRELAIQIEEELLAFTHRMNIHSVCCVGGMSIGGQITKLRHKNSFIIGTPGRLKDLIERKKINLAEFNNVVLDEADRMLDMGFINDMRYIMKLVPRPRQTLFFSATLSSSIEALISEFLQDPIKVSVKTADTSKNVHQDVVHFRDSADKIETLEKLLSQEECNKVLIFGRTKHGVENLSKLLIKKGIGAVSIHGNKNHNHRQRALTLFKTNKVRIMVATDVAARGLDIPNVSHVINYDVPETYTDYVHRIGRTGRGDNYGKALTFIQS